MGRGRPSRNTGQVLDRILQGACAVYSWTEVRIWNFWLRVTADFFALVTQVLVSV